MNFKLKKRREGLCLPNGSESIEIEGKMIDLEMEARDRLQSLVNGNYDNRKYCEEVFGIFDVTFEHDYSDVVEFMGAKKGVLKTEHRVLAFNSYITNKRENLEFYSWHRLSYEVAHYDVDLDRSYTLDEVENLVKTGKVILLKVAKKTNQIKIEDCNGKSVEEIFPTLENYDFSNLEKNGIDNNQLVLGMVRTIFDYPVARKILSKLNESLTYSLYNLKEKSLSMKETLLKRVQNYDEFASSCDEKIKKMGINKTEESK